MSTDNASLIGARVWKCVCGATNEQFQRVCGCGRTRSEATEGTLTEPRFVYVTNDPHGGYKTVYRSFGVNVPYWIWRLTPSRFCEMELS